MDKLDRSWTDPDRQHYGLIRLLLRVTRDVARPNGANDRQKLHHVPAHHPVLTERDIQVLEAMSHGMGRQGAADILGIGEETVMSHLKEARRVLRAKNTTHACCEALRQELIH